MKLDTSKPIASVNYNGVEMELASAADILEIATQADLIAQIKTKLRLLPSEYTPLDYIESTGTQYINWGVSVPHENERTTVVFSPTEPISGQDNALCGHAAPSWSWATNLAFVLNERMYVANTTMGVAAITVGNFYTFEYTRYTGVVDGASQELTGAAGATFTDGYNNTLFYASTKYGKHRVKYYKLCNGSTPVRDAVPCLNASGEAGMYDFVSGVFYGNAGTGEFAFPPPASSPSYPSQIEQNTADLGDILDAVTALPPTGPVLLWTNASPTSAFYAQKIALNGSEYSDYLVEARAHKTNANTTLTIIRMTDVYSQYIAGYYNTSYASLCCRAIGGADTTGINFGGVAGSGSTSTDAVPVRIYGVNFTL